MSNTNTKTITIPKDRNPFIVIVNGVEYKYPAGETVTVPDSVADVIEKYENAKPKPDPNPAPGGGGFFDVVFSRTESDDGSYVYTVDKSIEECISAHRAGKILRMYANWYAGVYGILYTLIDTESAKNVSFLLFMMGSSLSVSQFDYGYDDSGHSWLDVTEAKINYDAKPN